jgi:hypothetical protein
MAAGLGFKDFTTGEVLTAADVDGYLMQGIWVFANATARDAAVTSPQEGNSCYLKDTDVIQVYSGSSWVVKSGGSSPLTTKGDLYTYSTTDTRLASSGVNNDVLTVDTSTATGLKWAAASGGGSLTLTSIASGSLTSGTTLNITGLTQDYLFLRISGINCGSAGDVRLTFNGNTGANYDYLRLRTTVSGAFQGQQMNINDTGVSLVMDNSLKASDTDNGWTIEIQNAKAAGMTTFDVNAGFIHSASNLSIGSCTGYFDEAAAITSLTITFAGSLSAGTYELIGG